MSRIVSYRYPLEAGGELIVDRLLEAVDGVGRVYIAVEIEAATFPEAVRACAEAGRRVQNAGLPAVAFRDGSATCPGCERPEEGPGHGEEHVSEPETLFG